MIPTIIHLFVIFIEIILDNTAIYYFTSLGSGIAETPTRRTREPTRQTCEANKLGPENRWANRGHSRRAGTGRCVAKSVSIPRASIVHSPNAEVNAAGLPGGLLRFSIQPRRVDPVLGRAWGAKDRDRVAETETKAGRVMRGRDRFETSVRSYCSLGLELPHFDFGLVGHLPELSPIARPRS